MIQGLSERLKKMRTDNGFSQRWVAQRLDVSPSIISSYENGERTPSTEMLLALSYLYRCSTDYLLGKEMAKQCVVLNVEGLSSKQVRLINELVENMREGHK